jgi:sporulation protein YlmC with PRC-barrel domain
MTEEKITKEAIETVKDEVKGKQFLFEGEVIGEVINSEMDWVEGCIIATVILDTNTKGGWILAEKFGSPNLRATIRLGGPVSEENEGEVTFEKMDGVDDGRLP